MGKVITTKRMEGELEKAQDYVRTHILFPSGLLGLAAMVVGVVGLLVQLIAGSYEVATFLSSSALLLLGVVVGWGQTKYHQFLLREYPAFFASRLRTTTQRTLHRAKKAVSEAPADHRGRGWVPLLYVIGIVLFIAASAWSVSAADLSAIPAFTLPWAGFFWAKMFFWKGIVKPPKKIGKGRGK